MKQVARRLEARLRARGQDVKVGTAYALLSSNHTADKARWTLFVYSLEPDSVSIEMEFENYPTQIHMMPKCLMS